MHSRVVIVIEVSGEDPLQVRFAQQDDVIQAFAADGTDQSLDVRILPRRARGGDHFLDAQVVDPLAEADAVDAVAVALQVAQRRVVWKRFDDLLRGPGRAGVGRDVDEDNAAALDAEDDEHVQHAKRGGRHDKKVDGRQLARVVLQERLPSRRGVQRVAKQVLAHGRFCHVMSEQFQFGLDARRAPGRILAAQAADEFADLPVDLRTAVLARSRLPAPVELEPLTMPAHDRLGFHDHQRLPPVAPRPRQPDPEYPIVWFQFRPRAFAPVGGQLLAQRQVF